jgi:hypothetical protein
MRGVSKGGVGYSIGASFHAHVTLNPTPVPLCILLPLPPGQVVVPGNLHHVPPSPYMVKEGWRGKWGAPFSASIAGVISNRMQLG